MLTEKEFLSAQQGAKSAGHKVIADHLGDLILWQPVSSGAIIRSGDQDCKAKTGMNSTDLTRRVDALYWAAYDAHLAAVYREVI